jgi:conjugal transfer/entry exclusion protein
VNTALIILSAGAIAVWIVRNQNNNRKVIMSKLSELAATLNGLADKAETIKTSLDDFKSSLGDATLPPDAQAALDRLTGDVTALQADVPTSSTGSGDTTPANP